jgi:hypothetical protein
MIHPDRLLVPLACASCVPPPAQAHLRNPIIERRVPDHFNSALPGHKKLNTTMIYARALDQTVAEDYFKAMEQVEQDLDLPANQSNEPLVIDGFKRAELMKLAEQLAEPHISLDSRLELVSHLQWFPNGNRGELKMLLPSTNEPKEPAQNRRPKKSSTIRLSVRSPSKVL